MGVPGLKVKERREVSRGLGELGEQTEQLLRDGRFEQAIELLEAATAADDANPAALVLLADVHLTDAREVMLDRLEAKAELALSLLDRALAAGETDSVVKRLRTDVGRVVERERRTRVRLEARLEKLLTGGADAAEFTRNQLEDCAIMLSRRNDYSRAAQLYRMAEAVAEREPPPVVGGRVRTRNSFNYRIRALICSVQAGELEQIQGELEPALTFDWNAGGIPEDRYTLESLFVALLEHAAASQDWPQFRVWWQRAVERCKELDIPFPFGNRRAERLRELCARGGLHELAASIGSV